MEIIVEFRMHNVADTHHTKLYSLGDHFLCRKYHNAANT